MPNISIFGSVYEILSEDNFPLDAYLEEVKSGRYEDEVYEIRLEKDERARTNMKRRISRVTFSGVFKERKNDGLIEHSGYIAIDLDDLEHPEDTKKLLSEDKFVYAIFLSTGGKGLTVLFRIKPQKHRESFLGIAEYLLNNYNLTVDPQSISVAKPFGVTFDPFIYIADKGVPMFTSYPKETKIEKLPSFAFAKDDFEKLISQIEKRNINICDEYERWLKVGFAFASKFGEDGRKYFHSVSAVSQKYNVKRTDDQYKYCLRSKNLNVASISTFYYYCKEAGLQITSEKTTLVRKVTMNSKSAGLSKEQIIENLKKFENITGVDELVSEIFDGQADIGEGDTTLVQLEIFMSANYHLEFNEISRMIEQDGVPIDTRGINSIYVHSKKTIAELHYGDFDRLLFSKFINRYNPIIRFLEKLPQKEVMKNGEFHTPLIDKLASTVQNDISPYTEYFIKKWLVSSMSAAYGEHSPLMLVLSGAKHGTGKTEWFRRLLPPEVKNKFYAESKLDAGKDDEILMTQKWFIMDDEMSGKSKREQQRLKEITSKQYFSLREPYARTNTDLMRLAVLCGTTNSDQILGDISNRRIIPIPVVNIDKGKFNSIDKYELFGEIHSLYQAGFDWTVISDSDINYLNTYKENFEVLFAEKELIMKFFSPDKPDTFMTGTEIKVEIEKMTNQKLSLQMIGQQMTKLGFINKSVRDESGNSSKKWWVRKVNRANEMTFTQEQIDKNTYNGYKPIEGDGAPF